MISSKTHSVFTKLACSQREVHILQREVRVLSVKCDDIIKNAQCFRLALGVKCAFPSGNCDDIIKNAVFSLSWLALGKLVSVSVISYVLFISWQHRVRKVARLPYLFSLRRKSSSPVKRLHVLPLSKNGDIVIF